MEKGWAPHRARLSLHCPVTTDPYEAQRPVIDALSSPATYPPRDGVDTVEVRETHSAVVFLAGNRAYKMKKAVDYGFLDFTTLQKRRYSCYQELFLNQRAAPDIYREVRAVIPNGRGGYRIVAEENPAAVEYLVQMVRLPEDMMLNARLERGEVTPEMMAELGRTVANVHATAQTSDKIAAAGDLEGVRFNVEENFEQTEAYIGRTISRETYDAICKYARRFMERRETLFHSRSQNGFVRDTHGDLHVQQICIEANGRIHVLDCIDFNERFRYGDVAWDVGFMAMDLETRGHPNLARAFVDGYLERADDPGMPELLPFYQCYRAYVRGKVEGFRLDQPDLSDQEAAEVKERAEAYFRLAEQYARTMIGPNIVLIGGLMGTGKSTLAEGLARERGHAYLSSDVVRKQLAGVPEDERHFVEWNTEIYSPEMTERTYNETARLAAEALSQGRSVVVDASFSTPQQRQRFKDLSNTTGVPLLLAICELSEEETRRRLDARVEAGGVPTDGRWEIYAAQRDSFQPPAELSAGSVIHLDTSGSSEAVIETLVSHLDADTIE